MLHFTKARISHTEPVPVGYIVVLFFQNVSYHHSKTVRSEKDAETILDQWKKQGVFSPTADKTAEIVPLFASLKAKA